MAIRLLAQAIWLDEPFVFKLRLSLADADVHLLIPLGISPADSGVFASRGRPPPPCFARSRGREACGDPSHTRSPPILDPARDATEAMALRPRQGSDSDDSSSSSNDLAHRCRASDVRPGTATSS